MDACKKYLTGKVRAIERVQLRTQLQQRIERERVVAQITRQIHQSLNLEEILNTTVEQVRQFLQTDRVLVFQIEADGNGVVVAESVGLGWRSLLSENIYDPCLAESYLTENHIESDRVQPVSYDSGFNENYLERYRHGWVTTISNIDNGGIEPCHRELLAQFQVQANMVVPILHDDRFWGLLIAHHCFSPRVWQAVEIELLKELAIQVSIALQQAELYQQAQRQLRERQQAEIQLHNSEELLRQLTENINVAFWCLEIPSRQVSYVSPACERLWGLSREGLYSGEQSWLSLIHPDDFQHTERAFQEKACVGEFNEEYRIVLPDGRMRWIHDRCFPLQNDQGRVYRLTGIAEDITERKQAELALRENDEIIRNQLAEIEAIYQTAPIGLAVLDQDLRFVRLNQRLAEINGISVQEHLGRTLGDVLPFLQDNLEPLFRYVLESGEPLLNLEVNGETPAQPGLQRTWIENWFPLKQADGETIGINAVVQEITDRKQAEIQREQLLQREKFAKEEAERANRIKDEFLAILSHELRSPLNPILGWATLMQSQKFDPVKLPQGLATIERNAKLQIQLIDDLLDVAKILRGKLNIEMAAVDLIGVIDSALETVKSAAQAKSIKLNSFLPQIGEVSGDATRLQQIVWNLLSNAIKFTPKHGRVEVRLQQVGEDAQITVSDTGKGIKPEFLPHVFESFRQEDTSTTRKYGGLGLGLAIVRALVEAHGGTIWAESSGEGQGAVFNITLPLVNTELINTQANSDRSNHDENDESLAESLDESLDESLEESPGQNINLTGVRILAVDDESDTRQLLTAVLTQYGAQVLTLAKASEVLPSLETFQPNILISDIGMPEIDGFKLIQQVRSLPPHQGGNIPAIALTAYAREEEQHKCLLEGFQQHLSKPVDLNTLVAVIFELYRQ